PLGGIPPSGSRRHCHDDLVLLARLGKPWRDRTPSEEREDRVAFDQRAALEAVRDDPCDRRLSCTRWSGDDEQRRRARVLLALVRKHWISQVLRAATTASDAGRDLELVEGVGEHVAEVPE